MTAEDIPIPPIRDSRTQKRDADTLGISVRSLMRIGGMRRLNLMSEEARTFTINQARNSRKVYTKSEVAPLSDPL